jgi:transposase
MSNRYTTGYKEQAVQKALRRGTVNLKTLAQDLGVGYSTLQKWIRRYKNMNPDINMKAAQSPRDWTRKEQFQALLDTGVMDTEHRSQYCREKGLFPHHLDQWRQYFLQAGEANKKDSNAKLKSLKEENTHLHKAILRKDKALAETAALLVLQKKFQALWEEKGN